MKGIIIRATGGLFTVMTEDETTVFARAKGIFRRRGISPSVGDHVLLELELNNEPLISGILERKNFLIRPPIANLDAAALVISSVLPAPNTYIIDKMLMILEQQHIKSLLIFTKIDCEIPTEIVDIYESVGYPIFLVNNVTGAGTDAVRDAILGLTTAFIGNSGVGKSMLLQRLLPGKVLPSAEVSEKLGRGRHTTREINLFSMETGAPIVKGACSEFVPQKQATLVADTPGFSTIEAARYGAFKREEIAYLFREFLPYLDGKCAYDDCSHVKESDCAVKNAVAGGQISAERYANFCRIYAEIGSQY